MKQMDCKLQGGQNFFETIRTFKKNSYNEYNFEMRKNRTFEKNKTNFEETHQNSICLLQLFIHCP